MTALAAVALLVAPRAGASPASEAFPPAAALALAPVTAPASAPGSGPAGPPPPSRPGARSPAGGPPVVKTPVAVGRGGAIATVDLDASRVG
ncbi:MAG TPA: hypothetical protein VKP11_00325, partial [Frankiaceae bacterium]|nr:hypothetical protein [Frankiaceae bacterium]